MDLRISELIKKQENLFSWRQFYQQNCLYDQANEVQKELEQASKEVEEAISIARAQGGEDDSEEYFVLVPD